MTREEYYLAKIQRFNHDKDHAHQSEMNILVEAEQFNLVKILNPKIYIDGNHWCVLHGENIQDGICGFGTTPQLAIIAFNKAFTTPLPNIK